MNFDKPWENISIKLINKNQVFQFFDTSINILYVLNGDVTFSYDDKTILLRQDDFVIIPKAKQSHLVINDAKVFQCKFNYTISLDKLKKYHFDTPANLYTSYGGWSNRKLIDFLGITARRFLNI